MGVVSFDLEVPTAVPPAKMFKGIVVDAQNIISKIMPDAVKGVDILEGDGGPGTIKQINFGEAGPLKYVKERADEIDKVNFRYVYTELESDGFQNRIEKVVTEMKFEASNDGGSICKYSRRYYTIGNAVLAEEEIQANKGMATGLFKAVEGYLLANPDA